MLKNRPLTWLPRAQASRVSPAVAETVYGGCWHYMPGTEPSSDDTRGLRRLRALELGSFCSPHSLEEASRARLQKFGLVAQWWPDSLQNWVQVLTLPPAVLLLSGD